MLSMKTLKVAIVTMGSALLLGPGLATAVDLDGPGEGYVPLTYALESLGDVDPMDIITDRNDNPTHFGLTQAPGDMLVFSATTSLRLSGEWYLRVELGGGMVFGVEVDDPTAINTGSSGPGNANWERAQGGSAEDAQVVYALTTGTVNLDTTLTVDVTSDLAVPAAAGDYTATMTLHENLNDALEGRGATSMDFFGGRATVIRVASGLDADIVEGDALVAAVDTGFRWFVGPSNSELLGTFHAVANPKDVLAANSGVQAVDDDIIAMGGMALGLTVEGDLTIGAFTVVGGATTTPPTVEDCPAAAPEPVEDPENYLMGDLMNPDDPEADVTDVGVCHDGSGNVRPLRQRGSGRQGNEHQPDTGRRIHGYPLGHGSRCRCRANGSRERADR